jgi:hypothetical protein
MTISTSNPDELGGFPERHWEIASTRRWDDLCCGLRDYVPPRRLFSLPHIHKWEVVSAFQKAVRRGDGNTALKTVSAMSGMSEQYRYFWRRFCVVACEDIGPADETLALFVVACSIVFPPSRAAEQLYGILCFLAEQMCGIASRSRIYCSLSVVETLATSAPITYEQADTPIFDALEARVAEIMAPRTPFDEWLRRNDWRTERLLRYIGVSLPFEMTRVQVPIPPYTLLCGLPSYCYDMHTRVGLEMLRKLVRGVDGSEHIRDLLARYTVSSSHRVLGDALFFVEGGRIAGELIYQPLCSLEQRISAGRYGLPLEAWSELKCLVKEALDNGVVDRVREQVLNSVYGGPCRQLQLFEQSG